MWLMPRIESLKATLSDHEVRVVTSDRPAVPPIEDDQIAVCFGDGHWPEYESLLLFDEEVTPVCFAAVCRPSRAARR